MSTARLVIVVLISVVLWFTAYVLADTDIASAGVCAVGAIVVFRVALRGAEG